MIVQRNSRLEWFKVQKINAIQGDKKLILETCYIAEKYSNHPIAKAIIEYVENDKNIKIKNTSIDITEQKNYIYEEISGKGISVKNKYTLDNKKNNNNIIINNINNNVDNTDDIKEEINHILVGNKALMIENKIKNFRESDEIGTIIYVALNNQYIGNLIIRDEIKKSAQNIVSKLEKIGIKNIVMLTGDKTNIAETIAKKLKIKNIYSELFPQDKLTKLEEILVQKTKNKTIAYVGDGINDAPVLARADIGISMGGVASDVAIEASDIVLMDDDLNKILEAIKISKKTMSVVKQNIIISLTIKFIVLLLGIIGKANMWLAIFADVGVMVIAILNAILNKARNINK